MPINILMPALSPTMEKGNLAKWLKKEGDKVKSGDVIAEIETDKATMEVEAVDEGKIGKILVPAGTEGVKVNDVIAVLLEEGESTADIEVTGKTDTILGYKCNQFLVKDKGTITEMWVAEGLGTFMGLGSQGGGGQDGDARQRAVAHGRRPHGRCRWRVAAGCKAVQRADPAGMADH